MQSSFRLLVVRLGAMGDILHALPAVTALRNVHSSWIIDWVVEPAWKPLLTTANGAAAEALGAGQPLVNGVFVAPAKAWARKPLNPSTFRDIGGLRRVLREGRYDAVLDFQGAVRSALIARASGSGRVIGEAVPREWAARWFFSERIATRGRHVIEQDIELAAAVAGDRAGVRSAASPRGCRSGSMVLPASGAFGRSAGGAAQSRRRLGRQTLAGGTLCGCCIGARPLAGIQRAGECRAGRGSRSPKPSPRSPAGLPSPVQCSLAQLIALTRRIALAIGGDTGPLHLACALGRPVVGIYGPTDPARNGPYGTRFRVLRSPFSLRNHARREEPEAGLLTITPEDVLQGRRRSC